MHCPNCGSFITPGNKFCTECGTKVELVNDVIEQVPETADQVNGIVDQTSEALNQADNIAEVREQVSESVIETANDTERLVAQVEKELYSESEFSSDKMTAYKNINTDFSDNSSAVETMAEAALQVEEAVNEGLESGAAEIRENAAETFIFASDAEETLKDNEEVILNEAVSEIEAVAENNAESVIEEVAENNAESVIEEVAENEAESAIEAVAVNEAVMANAAIDFMKDSSEIINPELLENGSENYNQNEYMDGQEKYDQNQYANRQGAYDQSQYMNRQGDYNQGQYENQPGAQPENGNLNTQQNAGTADTGSEVNDSKASKKNSKKKKRGFGIRLVTILLGIITAAFLLVFIVYSSVLDTVSVKGLSDIIGEIPIEKIEVGSIVKNIEVDGVDTSKVEDDATVTELVLDLIPQENKDKYGITEESIEKVLSDPNVKNFISDKLSDYVDSFGTDTSVGVSKDEILELVKSSKDEIQEATGYTIKDSDLDFIEEKLDEVEIESYELPRVQNEIPDGLRFLTEGITGWGKWAVLGLTGLFALLILLCNINQIRFGFRALSLIMIIDGFLLCAAALVSKIGFSAADFGVDIDRNLIKPVENSFMMNLLKTSAIVLAAGVVLMIIVVIWKNIANAIERKREKA